jgi:transcriptional regulator with GAF, ATPase, and Fis domain
MEKNPFTPLLLELWREVCRHIEIGDSVARLAPMLADNLPADFLLVRHFDISLSRLETVATGICRPGHTALPPRSELSPEDLDRMLVWCRQGHSLRLVASKVISQFPGLLPPGMQGAVLVGPLNAEHAPLGVLIFGTRSRAGFGDRDEKLLSFLLEPFTVAMENDLRIRELNSLRETLEADKRSLLSRLGRTELSDTIVGAEAGLRPVMEQVELVAHSDVPVLILGETGSGKEVVARAIHNRSPRAAKPFLRVNCGAIPPELIDSELFGHEPGSFTGAVGVRKGWFERADGGTLFLDECGELPSAAQVRLLRILQDGTFERVGGERQLTVHVRVVLATHRDLHAMVAERKFREDLWYRIAVFPIRLPPLRERKEDIPPLAAHFAMRAAKRLGTRPLAPQPEDIAVLLSYAWPGNVRELSAVIERAAILGEGKTLEVARALGVAYAAPGTAYVPQRDKRQDTLSAYNSRPAGHGSEADHAGEFDTLNDAMVRQIELALARTHGRIEGRHGAALILGINPHTLRARMRKLGINWQKFRLGRSDP